MQSILVTSYVNPDLDGIASVVAYAEFLKKISKKSVAGIIGEPHFEAKYIFDRFGFSY
ncbi:MAG: Inorganic pyrophosphatase/exopolyphosphatase, partial [Parcubacteria group bacterium GW2011_GWB1_37_13]